MRCPQSPTRSGSEHVGGCQLASKPILPPQTRPRPQQGPLEGAPSSTSAAFLAACEGSPGAIPKVLGKLPEPEPHLYLPEAFWGLGDPRAHPAAQLLLQQKEEPLCLKEHRPQSEGPGFPLGPRSDPKLAGPDCERLEYAVNSPRLGGSPEV